MQRLQTVNGYLRIENRVSQSKRQLCYETYQGADQSVTDIVDCIFCILLTSNHIFFLVQFGINKPS